MLLYWDVYVIFTADDFGGSPEINAAILRAHRHGVLSAASLMAAAPAWQEAARLAQATPTLAVGLHLTVVGGQAVLPRKDIPHLVDDRGRFPAHPVAAGLRYAFGRRLRQELKLELEAQCERFVGVGLPLSHVDGHMHMHMHPLLFDLVVSLAEQYGAAGIRAPHDDLRQSLRFEPRQAGAKLLWTLVFGGLRWRARARLRSSGLVVAERVFGLLQSGRMEEAYVVRVLQTLRHETAELFFHPTLAAASERLGPNPGDLATLLSPRLRQVLAARGLHLATYPQIQRRRRQP
jgi:hopanoid biosynthesis associated protein HpnK